MHEPGTTGEPHDQQPVDGPAPLGMGRKVRIVVFAMIVVALAVAGAIFHERLPSATEIRDATRDAGPWAPLAFVPAAAALKMLVFPSSIISVAAGLLFGPWLGTGLIVIASTVAACAQLLVTRYVAGEQIQRHLPQQLHTFDRFLERRGWLAIMYLRMIPVSHNAINYGAGFTSLRLSHMALGTAIGSAPMAFAYAELGAHAHDLSAPEVKLAITLLVVLALGGALLSRHQRRREGDHRA